MVMRRLFGRGSPPEPSEPAGPASGAAPASASAAETATVRKIVSQLEALPEDEARFLAGFAYVLSRAANADEAIGEDEVRVMEAIVVQYGHLTEAQAVLVVEIARTQARLYGGTEDYLVTREFREQATTEQRRDLLRCCYLVGAADGSITAPENAVLSGLSDELEVDQKDVSAIRADFTEQFSAVQELRRQGIGGTPTAS